MEPSTERYEKKTRTAEIPIPGEYCLDILVAEDNEIIIRYLKSLLRRHLSPCKLSFAQDGYEVLKLTNETRFDLLLIDHSLTGMNGEELTTALRSTKNETPIILLALSEIKIPFESMVGLGVDGIVYKPIIIDELMQEIEAILRVNSTDRGTASKFHPAIEDHKH